LCKFTDGFFLTPEPVVQLFHAERVEWQKRGERIGIDLDADARLRRVSKAMHANAIAPGERGGQIEHGDG
jgi:hypothetical protein